METRVVEGARVRAEVKRAHITPLKTRLRAKNVCGEGEGVRHDW